MIDLDSTVSFLAVSYTHLDGRLLSTYAIVHEMLNDTHPQYAYRYGMSAQEFTQWQDGVRAAMVEIMKIPEIKRHPSPVCVKTEKKDGYILENMEFYPFPKSVSTFLVLKPEHLKGAVPGVLCIPGSGRTKEGLALSLIHIYPHDLISQLHASQVGNSEKYQPYISCIQILKRAIFSLSSYYLTIIHTPESA